MRHASRRFGRLDKSWILTLLAAGAALALGAPSSASAQIVVNEILQNPSVVADGDGEWFEVFNPGAGAVDINGWTIEDNDFDSHLIANGGPLLVPAGGYLVLGNNGNAGTNGGVAVDYVFTGIALANGGDELVLRDQLLNEVDRVEWDGGPVFPDPNGASMALADPGLDNNDGANWCTASTPFGSGDLGTPGAANDCPAVVPEVVINEIMQNPSAVGDSAGEWLELFNPTGAPIDIDGWTVADNDFDSFVIANGGPLVIPAGGFVVLGNNGDSLSNGGVTVDYVYAGFFLSNSADEVVLFDGLLNEVDRVEYDDGATFPDPNGASMALADPALDNNDGANWCTSATAFGAGDLGTPGAANDCPPPAVPGIVINEIMQNPSAVSDGSGEWFEIVNTTADPIDIDGWTIADNDFDSHVIANGGALVVPGGGFLVLGNNADFATNGGVTVGYEYSGVFLSNSSDELVLFDGGSEVDRVEWDNGATFPDPSGISMSLKNPVLDNNVGANWCEASTPFGSGDLGTPGAANDCFAGLVINEVDADQTSTDDAEFIEIYDGGDGNTDLSGLVLVLFNGSDDASYRAFDLDGRSTDANGFFVLCGNAANTAGCDLDVSPDTNLIQNGADAVALMVGDAADFPNDTPVTTEGLLDALVYDTNDSDDGGLLPLLNAGQPQVNEGGQGSKDLHSNQRCPNGFGGQRNTDTYFQNTPTAGSLNNCPPIEIFTIQGSGSASPYDGFIVLSTDNVVTAVRDTGAGIDGFFMQTPAARADGDIDTSDGIFVFTGSDPGVAVGDLVTVTGAVDEFFGFTEMIVDPANLMITGFGALPLAVAFDATVPSPDPAFPSCSIEYECYEGMLVEVAAGTVTGPNQGFGSDPIAEVHVVATTSRTFREPGIEYPGDRAVPAMGR